MSLQDWLKSRWLIKHQTSRLTERFVQFVLSGKIPQNHLRNIIAITFSNNAAKEMKERILSWLKDIYFKDPEKVEELSEIVKKRTGGQTSVIRYWRFGIIPKKVGRF